MLSIIGFVAVMLIVFTVGFAVGRKPPEPITINLKFEEFNYDDLELCRDLLKGAADRIQEAMDSYEDEEPESEEEEEPAEEQSLLESEEANKDE